MTSLIDLKTFVDEGYLQELNRQFLHPLGLALVVHEDSKGNLQIKGISDYRDEPGGIVFVEGVLNAAKAKNIEMLVQERIKERIREAGSWIQPVKKD